MRAVVFLLGLFGLVGLLGEVRAQEKSFDRLTELMPPTDEDWLRYRFAERAKSGCSNCVSVPPIKLYSTLHYLDVPEPVCDGSGRIAGVAQGLRGKYGIFHPGPYYIEEPRIVPVDVPWNRPDPRHPRFAVLPEQPSSPPPIRAFGPRL